MHSGQNARADQTRDERVSSADKDHFLTLNGQPRAFMMTVIGIAEDISKEGGTSRCSPTESDAGPKLLDYAKTLTELSADQPTGGVGGSGNAKVQVVTILGDPS
jgi:hypothetical protein